MASSWLTNDLLQQSEDDAMMDGVREIIACPACGDWFRIEDGGSVRMVGHRSPVFDCALCGWRGTSVQRFDVVQVSRVRELEVQVQEAREERDGQLRCYGDLSNTATKIASERDELRAQVQLLQAERDVARRSIGDEVQWKLQERRRAVAAEVETSRLREVLEQIASCATAVEGDCPSIARVALGL